LTTYSSRVAVALVGIPLMLVSAWWGGWLLAALVALIGVLAVREGWRLLTGLPPDVITLPAYLLALWAPVAARLHWPFSFTVALVLATLTVGVLALFKPPASGKIRVPSALMLLLYPVTLLQALLWIRLDSGATDLFYLLALVWAGDTAAFEGGKRTGHRALAARLSPHKTVEGALWGLAASLLVGVLAALLWPWAHSLTWFLLAAVVVWFLAVTGDLFESLLKRSAGVKDSGTLLSAHGGVLDRFDSLLWAGAGLYLLTLMRF
jgi:phosphatidate cytidylyltransferase